MIELSLCLDDVSGRQAKYQHWNMFLLDTSISKEVQTVYMYRVIQKSCFIGQLCY